jgi:hypothetical protein
MVITPRPSRGGSLFSRLIREPPLRTFVWAFFRVAPVSIRVKAAWCAANRPQYLVGVLEAADQARRQGISAVSVIEFGVASGQGLLILEACAKAIAEQTGVEVAVFGFDTGKGLPQPIGDHRDHPDLWQPGDFPMDEDKLRRQLSSRTTLVIGNVAETVPRFVAAAEHPPVGFAAIDLDLYSSTRDALQLLSSPDRHMLHRVALYFDDVIGLGHHSFAGERLAISEFNAANECVKIDRWYSLAHGNPFPEHAWLTKMYMAHDLEAISRDNAAPRRPTRFL